MEPMNPGTNKLWSHPDNQHTVDRIAAHSEWDYSIEGEHVHFLIRLCSQLYSEDRMTGDQMRNLAQTLDHVIDHLEPYTKVYTD